MKVQKTEIVESTKLALKMAMQLPDIVEAQANAIRLSTIKDEIKSNYGRMKASINKVLDDTYKESAKTKEEKRMLKDIQRQMSFLFDYYDEVIKELTNEENPVEENIGLEKLYRVAEYAKELAEENSDVKFEDNSETNVGTEEDRQLT